MAFGRFGTAANLLCRLAAANMWRPRTRSLEMRLAMLPIAGAPISHPVTILWDDHQIPFIEAETDGDLATALGIVHAHLRLGQMELMRRLARGCVSEIAGRLGIGLDRLVRAFDIARAGPRILAAMPVETRSWLENFARGINHILDRAPELPREFVLLGLAREPWSAADIVTLGRLIAADVNWLVWMRLLKYRDDPDWPHLWRRLLRHDLLSFESGNDAGAASGLGQTLAGATLRSGSNSLAVASALSESGGPLMANDPHLSFVLPNPFLLTGLKSPSHHAVGMMVPGIPFVGIGRSPWIAWGGASLHAASSDLVAVPKGTELGTRVETIRVRGEPDVTLNIRESPWGPVVSDLPGFRARNEVLALRWMGHEPSDEFTAMLRVGRARNWDEFRQAFDGYAIPGLEMNFADSAGHIGQLTAARLPRRAVPDPDDIVSPPANGWDAPLATPDLPARYDPPEGFVASANARPEAGAQVVGFHFSPPDRLRRLCRLLGNGEKLSLSGLMRIQRDVHLSQALVQRDTLLAWLREGSPPARTKRLCDALQSWDGNYDAQSKGAAAFELLFFHLARELVTRSRRAAYDAAWGTRALIWDDICATPADARTEALVRAVKRAAIRFGRGLNWGRYHRLVLAHTLGLIPVLGRRYRFADLPAAGTSETLMKTAHGLTHRRHRARYGSVARHISDLADPDANYFALLGGQDGWLESTTFGDQVALWQRGDYIRLPLLPDSLRESFRHRTILSPGAPP
jgi:penicillin amidase